METTLKDKRRDGKDKNWRHDCSIEVDGCTGIFSNYGLEIAVDTHWSGRLAQKFLHEAVSLLFLTLSKH